MIYLDNLRYIWKKSSAWVIVVHVIGWLWFLAFPLVFLNAGDSTGNVLAILTDETYWQFILPFFLIFYLNSQVLVRKLFLRKKYSGFIVIILVLFVGICIIQPFDKVLTHNHFEQPAPFDGPDRRDAVFREGEMPHNRPPHLRRVHIDTVSVYIFIMIIALSTAVEITRQWTLTERRAAIAEAGKANAELSFLKAQINPHFLFNTLNNIYTLAITGSKYTPDSIMKLSTIMRYVTDEVSADFVPLEHEIECIENYIDLQRLRIGKKTEIDYKVTGDTSEKIVAPLILMTFVENVFKHGISKRSISKLVINISISEEYIYLFCQNPIHHILSEKRNGIGIENARQRLNHLYPEKNILKIDDSNDIYTVELKIYT